MNHASDPCSVPPLPLELPKGSLNPDFVMVFEQAVRRAAQACLDTGRGYRFEGATSTNDNGHWIGGRLDLGGHFPSKPWVGFKLDADRGEVQLWWWIEAELSDGVTRKGGCSELFQKSDWASGGDARGVSYFHSCGRVEPGTNFAFSVKALESGIEFLIHRLGPALQRLH